MSERILGRTPPRYLLGMILASIVATSGCRTPGLYRACDLPPQFAALPPAHPQMFNLARFAQGGTRSELAQPGDLLDVTIATGLEEGKPSPWPLRVSDNGELTVPLIGPVRVGGMELNDCEKAIRFAAVERGQFVDPNVTVELRDRKKNRVSVVGAVNDPGIKSIPTGQSDLFNALVAAGGLSDEASTVVEIRHPGGGANDARLTSNSSSQTELASYRPGSGMTLPPRQLRYDLREITAGSNGDFHVEDGSMVIVSPKPRSYVQVLGLVKKPDQFEMKVGQETRLLDALAMANGRTLEVADKVHIIRRVPQQAEPILIEASVRKAKRNGAENLVLAPGDVVSVEETPTTFLIGTIREFVRFGFTSAIPGI